MDLDQLIGEFKGTVLSGIEFSQIFSRVFDLLRDYHLVLPPDLAILLRTLLTAEGFVRSMAPDYNIAEETRPIMVELLTERFSLVGARSGLKKIRSQLLGMTGFLPDILASASSIAKSGYLPVQLDPVTVERLASGHNDSPSPKGPVAAALIVAAALLVDQSWWLAGVTLASAAMVLLRK